MSLTISDKDLGLVTAYAYAVSKGYTGTEEEFAELMASYASVAEQAAQSATAAAGSADSAASSASSSASSAADASVSAGSAADSASNAASSAASAASSAASADSSASTATQKASEASTSASNASASATNAASSEDAAADSAAAAAASATAAGNAQTAAETAQGKAEDAQEAAETAQEAAETAAQSVSQSAAQISQNASDISDLKSALTNATRTISMYDNEIEIAVPNSQGKRIQYFFFADHQYRINTSGNADARMNLYTKQNMDSSENLETIAMNFPGSATIYFTPTVNAECLALYCNDSGVTLTVDDLNDTTNDLKRAFFGKKSISTSTSFDCNQAEKNSVYYFNNATNVSNAPISSPVNGNLITFGVSQSTDIVTQIFQRYTTNGPELYQRMCFGTWGSWHYIPKDEIVKMCFSMFQTWGVIGDSFASGVFKDESTGNLDNHLLKSWPQILARKAGNQCVNFSMGGLYCGSWLTNNDRGLPFLLSEPAKELYIITLGINDISKLSGVQPLGTIGDINEDYSQNPSTFFGNYGKIIGNIQTHAPNAKIILSTTPYTFTDAMLINNAIISIASHFGLPCLPVHTDQFFRSSYFWANFEQDHPKSFVYSAMANAYNRLICDSLRNDTSYWGDTFN